MRGTEGVDEGWMICIAQSRHGSPHKSITSNALQKGYNHLTKLDSASPAFYHPPIHSSIYSTKTKNEMHISLIHLLGLTSLITVLPTLTHLTSTRSSNRMAVPAYRQRLKPLTRREDMVETIHTRRKHQYKRLCVVCLSRWSDDCCYLCGDPEDH